MMYLSRTIKFAIGSQNNIVQFTLLQKKTLRIVKIFLLNSPLMIINSLLSHYSCEFICLACCAKSLLSVQKCEIEEFITVVVVASSCG